MRRRRPAKRPGLSAIIRRRPVILSAKQKGKRRKREDSMIIGLPKEIKDNEYRVGLTPAGVKTLSDYGNTVLVETKAGDGSGISDEEYSAAQGRIVETADEVWQRAEMIVKVKEPVGPEYKRMREGQILFTYLHLAPDRKLTQAMLESGITGVAYETITNDEGHLPLLTPMSEVAGRMAVQVGAHYLDDIFGAKIKTLVSNPYTVQDACANADLVIGAVLIPGASAPMLVTREMLKTMHKGSVIVDVAVDQGGCIETTKPTTHSDPTFYVDDVLHYCVANMPGAVPRTSTFALTNATLPLAIKLANKGFKDAIAKDGHLKEGVNTYAGHITYEAVAESQGLKYKPIDDLL